MSDFPIYLCHKRVRAAKLYDVKRPSVDGADTVLTFAGMFPDRYVDAAWVAKHSPQPGDYIVIYEDGYESISPAGVFEAGYSLDDRRV